MSCDTCGGLGHVCIDDLCHSGDCMHGDADCPECFGDPDYGYDEDEEADMVLGQERDEVGRD